MSSQPVALIVCPVVPYPPVSGARKRTLRILEGIARVGVTPHLLTSDPAAEQQRKPLEDRGWRLDFVHEPDPSRASRARQHLARRPSPYLDRLAGRLRELVVTERPAWVQLEHCWSAYYLPELSATRSVWSLHNLDSQMLRSSTLALPLGLRRARGSLRWRAARATEQWAAPRADLVVCVTEGERDVLDGLGSRTMLVPNGVDAALCELAETAAEGDDVLFFGQLLYEPNRRGITRFVREAWPLVAAAHPQARLRIVGEGADDQLRQLAALSPSVEVVGLVPEIDVELARAAVVVAPVWEGAGSRLKVLEAMAAARPVVGTPLGVSGIGFIDQLHGLVADSPAALAQATVAQLGAPHQRATAGQAARTLARSFIWERVMVPLEAQFESWSQTPASEPDLEIR
jgi:polysaccharide biosynthesis protein PslH